MTVLVLLATPQAVHVAPESLDVNTIVAVEAVAPMYTRLPLELQVSRPPT